MVRTYVRKTKRGDYSKETFEEALEEIKAGRMNAHQASKKYSIPYQTINSHLKGTRGTKSKSFGRSTAIPIEYEKRIAEGLEKYGFELSRKEVQELVGQFVNENKIKTPFKNGVPGEDWLLGFAKRHNFSIKKPQSVEIATENSCNPFTLKEEIATSSKDDKSNLCSICKCDFQHCIKKEDWTQCVTCTQLVCGTCNKDSKKRPYECERCLSSD